MALHAMLRAGRSGSSVINLVAVLSLLLAGGACGWFVHDKLTLRNDEALRQSGYVRTLLRAHRMFALAPPPGAISPADQFARFSKRVDEGLGTPVQLPEQADLPLTYRGGRLFPLDEALAALLVFDCGQGRLSLVIAPDRLGGARAMVHRNMDDTSITLGDAGAFLLGVIGPASQAELDALMQLIGDPRAKASVVPTVANFLLPS
jgi:anti-sigma factor RsiW